MHHPAAKKTAFLPWAKKQSKRRFCPERFVNKQSDFAGTGATARPGMRAPQHCCYYFSSNSFLIRFCWCPQQQGGEGCRCLYIVVIILASSAPAAFMKQNSGSNNNGIAAGVLFVYVVSSSYQHR